MICIYIYREREIERERYTYTYMYVYIYIYILYVYIYIYIYYIYACAPLSHWARAGVPARLVARNPEIREFDLSRSLLLKGEISQDERRSSKSSAWGFLRHERLLRASGVCEQAGWHGGHEGINSNSNSNSNSNTCARGVAAKARPDSQAGKGQPGSQTARQPRQPDSQTLAFKVPRCQWRRACPQEPALPPDRRGT